jgi:hypothetical protein
MNGPEKALVLEGSTSQVGMRYEYFSYRRNSLQWIHQSASQISNSYRDGSFRSKYTGI